jgi:endoglucanase
MKYGKTMGTALIALGVVIVVVVLYHNSQKRQQAILFSPHFMLSVLWESYKKNYWESATGRTVDHQRNDITTSEGQSYTMLRAVWQDDKATFDKTWAWTQGNLKRPDSSLSSWAWGKRSDGSYGILETLGGQNTATDADSDIALALIFASSRWSNSAYLDQAKKILSDMWSQEVVAINGHPYLAADNLEKQTSGQVLVNPSYFAPYAYRIFAKIDTANDWQAVVGTSYSVLEKSSIASLDKTTSSGLPPDWIGINKTTEAVTAAASPNLTTNYGFDAMRIPFRIALDYQYSGDQRAKALLDRLYFLGAEWQSKGILASIYNHDGGVVSGEEAPAMYGTALGYFMVSEPNAAEAVYKNKLLVLYSPDFQDWKKPLPYYDDNWTWFGLALYNHELPDLSK